MIPCSCSADVAYMFNVTLSFLRGDAAAAGAVTHFIVAEAKSRGNWERSEEIANNGTHTKTANENWNRRE